MLLQEQNMTLMVKERKNCHSVLVARIRGWLLGTADGLNEGVVPANYVKQTDFGSSSWEEGIKRHQEGKCPRIIDTTDRTK